MHIVLKPKLLTLVFLIPMLSPLWLLGSQVNDEPSLELKIVPGECLSDPWTYQFAQATEIPTLNAVNREQEFQILLCMKQISVDHLQDLKVDLDVKDFRGQTVYHAGGMDFITTETASNESSERIYKAISYKFPESSEFGHYEIFAEIYNDENEILRASKVIDLIRMEVKPRFENNEDYEAWAGFYHSNPNIGEAITAYLYMTSFDFSSRDPGDRANIQNQCAFYFEILRNNKWVLPYLDDLYYESVDSVKFKIIFALTQLNYDNRDFFRAIKAPFDEFQNWAKTFTILEAGDAYESAVSIDINWAKFMATGRYKPIENIVLSLKEYEAGEDSHQANISRIIEWSLMSNLKRYKLVRQYCDYIYQKKSPNPFLKDKLATLLSM